MQTHHLIKKFVVIKMPLYLKDWFPIMCSYFLVLDHGAPYLNRCSFHIKLVKMVILLFSLLNCSSMKVIGKRRGSNDLEL